MSSKIGDLEPVTLAMCQEFLRDCEARMFPPIRITHTLRTMDEQLHLYAKGRRQTDEGWVVEDRKQVVTWAKPGASPHNYGAAFDICFVGRVPYPDDEQLWEAVGITGEACGLSWAGRWPKKKREFCHFENPAWRDLKGKRA